MRPSRDAAPRGPRLPAPTALVWEQGRPRDLLVGERSESWWAGRAVRQARRRAATHPSQSKPTPSACCLPSPGWVQVGQAVTELGDGGGWARTRPGWCPPPSLQLHAGILESLPPGHPGAHDLGMKQRINVPSPSAALILLEKTKNKKPLSLEFLSSAWDPCLADMWGPRLCLTQLQWSRARACASLSLSPPPMEAHHGPSARKHQ